MRKFLFVALVALVGCPKQEDGGNKAGSAPATQGEVKLETEEQKTFYALGLTLGDNIEVFDLKPEELEVVIAGIRGNFAEGEPPVKLNEYGRKVGELARARSQARAEALSAKSEAFINEAAAQEGATRTASGMVFQNLTEGSGESPTETSRVKVHYRGTLVDGTEFDSSYSRGEPATFPLNGVIKCWTEGVQLMKVGGKARLVCPPDLAYGPSARPGLPANSTLNFEVELLEILPAAAVPSSPGATGQQGQPRSQPRQGEQPAAE
ncbi:MAG TPA: FKBP-type peptidyl-prolyl cis-trans isomerase [Myxococcaceae bacterium]|nr:FKBP-type peptidyl-prolyl cis-trans isomerase [Myxococcaceae bacterium]